MFKRICGLIMIFSISFMIWGCGKELLNLEDVNFTVKQYFDEKKDLDNNYDLSFNILKDVGEVKASIYSEDRTKGTEKEKIATFNLKPDEYEKSISILNQPKGEYRYILLLDYNGGVVEKDLIINVSRDEDKEEDIKAEKKSNEENKEYKTWDSKGIDYKKGDKVEFEDKFYECIQNHKSQKDWTPNTAVSLWEEFNIK